MPQHKHINSVTRAVILTALAVSLVSCTGWFRSKQNLTGHLVLGNPSQAKQDVTEVANYLITKPQYALSYNNALGRPNWTSWQLHQSWLGEVERQDDFRPDSDLPQDWQDITPSDYRRSGYDRGHMVPSGDRTRSIEDNSATFVMSNIVPQSPDNNRGPWVDLERYARDLVEDGQSLYIIAGGYGRKRAIAQGRIKPPKRLWKIIVVSDRPKAQDISPADITSNTRVIAIDIPNVQGIRNRNWQDYRVAVDTIEAATGYDFLSEISPTVQARLEEKVDSVSID